MRNPNLRINAVAAAALAALAILGFIALPAFAGLKVNINIGGPGVVWQHRPPMVMMPGTRTYWARDYSNADVYQSGSWWYCLRGDNWYRSSSYRGPWNGVSMGVVPNEIVSAPVSYRHMSRPGPASPERGPGQSPGLHRGNSGNPGHPGNSGNKGNRGNNGGPGR